MSLLLPEHLRIGLGTSYALLARVSGAMLTHWQMQTWSPTNTVAPWQQALTTISGWLAEIKPRRLRITAVLSAELAPLHLLPWRDDAMNAEQQALLARAYFRHIHGEAVDHWKIIAQPSGYGQPWLAGAMDERLINAMPGLLQGASLISMQPLPLSLFNGLRNQLSAPASWLLVPDPERLTALHLRNNKWSLLQSLPIIRFEKASVNDLLLREARLAGLEDMPASIFSVSEITPGGIPLDTGWQRSRTIPEDAQLHLLGGRA